MVGAAEAAPWGPRIGSSNASTGRFRRTRGQSPHVLMVGAAEAAPWGPRIGSSNASTGVADGRGSRARTSGWSAPPSRRLEAANRRGGALRIPGRLWLAYWASALAGGAVGIALVLPSNHEDRPVPTLVLGLLLGWSFIASGLVARARSPDNPTGRLMVAFGFIWFLGALSESNQSLVFTLGAALSSLFAAVFVHLLLAYPTGRLASARERWFVAFAYVLAGLGPTGFLLVERHAQGCGKCPDSAFLIRESHTAATVVGGVLTVLAGAVLVTVMGILARRWHRATP